MTVANTILAQLGGSRFVAMTGAKNFVGGANALQFRIGAGAKNKANAIRITLTAADLYDVEFIRSRGLTFSIVEKVEGLFADDLRRVFTDRTGFLTSLAA